MAYAVDTAIANLGDIGKGGLANSKVVAYQNDDTVELPVGRFVAISDKGGVKALSAVTDKIAGVVPRDYIYGSRKAGETVGVMHIGTADSIFVEVADGKTVTRGNTVHVVATGDTVGVIQGEAEADKTIETPFTVIKVVGNIAEITRL